MAEHSLAHSPSVYCGSYHRLSLYQHARGRKSNPEGPFLHHRIVSPSLVALLLGTSSNTLNIHSVIFPIQKVGIIFALSDGHRMKYKLPAWHILTV